MSRLVRARMKPVEMLPEWAKCCPEMVAVIENMKGHELNAVMGSQFIADEVECCFCHRIEHGKRYVRTPSGKPFSLEIYDLDEGPYQEPNLNFPGQQKGAEL